MRSPAMKRAGSLLLGALVTVGVAGCYAEPYHRPGPPPPPPGHVHYWQPYDYFYYPSVGVYFNIYSGYYYYLDGRVWRRTLWLPPHIIILPRDRVTVKIYDKEPWHHYPEHQQRYHPAPRPPRDQMYREDRKERDYNSRQHRDFSRDRR